MADDDIDIIFATETHLNGEKDAELEHGEYNLSRRDRPVIGKPSGGVMIGIKKSLDSELVCCGKTAETIFCKINQRGKPPPSSLHVPIDPQIMILKFRLPLLRTFWTLELNSKHQNSSWVGI